MYLKDIKFSCGISKHIPIRLFHLSANPQCSSYILIVTWSSSDPYYRLRATAVALLRPCSRVICSIKSLLPSTTRYFPIAINSSRTHKRNSDYRITRSGVNEPRMMNEEETAGKPFRVWDLFHLVISDWTHV
ncbi:hypothetical protein J6590_010310 [Homalodisca vitripennis]|nr:hypothetical protein J6590_010310 [Homalodisca vitripennis]